MYMANEKFSITAVNGSTPNQSHITTGVELVSYQTPQPTAPPISPENSLREIPAVNPYGYEPVTYPDIKPNDNADKRAVKSNLSLPPLLTIVERMDETAFSQWCSQNLEDELLTENKAGKTPLETFLEHSNIKPNMFNQLVEFIRNKNLQDKYLEIMYLRQAKNKKSNYQFFWKLYDKFQDLNIELSPQKTYVILDKISTTSENRVALYQYFLKLVTDLMLQCLRYSDRKHIQELDVYKTLSPARHFKLAYPWSETFSLIMNYVEGKNISSLIKINRSNWEWYNYFILALINLHGQFNTAKDFKSVGYFEIFMDMLSKQCAPGSDFLINFRTRFIRVLDETVNSLPTIEKNILTNVVNKFKQNGLGHKHHLLAEKFASHGNYVDAIIEHIAALTTCYQTSSTAIEGLKSCISTLKDFAPIRETADLFKITPSLNRLIEFSRENPNIKLTNILKELKSLNCALINYFILMQCPAFRNPQKNLGTELGELVKIFYKEQLCLPLLLELAKLRDPFTFGLEAVRGVLPQSELSLLYLAKVMFSPVVQGKLTTDEFKLFKTAHENCVDIFEQKLIRLIPPERRIPALMYWGVYKDDLSFWDEAANLSKANNKSDVIDLTIAKLTSEFSEEIAIRTIQYVQMLEKVVKENEEVKATSQGIVDVSSQNILLMKAPEEAPIPSQTKEPEDKVVLTVSLSNENNKLGTDKITTPEESLLIEAEIPTIKRASQEETLKENIVPSANISNETISNQDKMAANVELLLKQVQMLTEQFHQLQVSIKNPAPVSVSDEEIDRLRLENEKLLQDKTKLQETVKDQADLLEEQTGLIESQDQTLIKQQKEIDTYKERIEKLNKKVVESRPSMWKKAPKKQSEQPTEISRSRSFSQ